MIAPNSDKPNGQPTTDTTPAESPKERKASRAKRNRQQAFLKAYVECGTISGAAQAAKISRTTHHRWLADENDVDYANAFALADEMFRSQLEDEARFRALQGLRRYKFNSKGEPVYVDCQKSHPEAVKYVDEKTGETRHRRHYYEENRSDVILIALLNEAFPDRFGRYRHDHAGKIEHGHAGKVNLVILQDSDWYGNEQQIKSANGSTTVVLPDNQRGDLNSGGLAERQRLNGDSKN